MTARGTAPPEPRGAPPGSLVLVWDPRFEQYDLGPGHPFSEAYRGLAVDLFERSLDASERERVEWVRSVEPASASTLESFHGGRYVEWVQEVGAGRATVMLDQGDTPGTPGCYEAAARIVGGTVEAFARTDAHRVPSFNPAGGLHHAHRDRASGFCIFNDVAVAIARPIARRRRIAYLDIDAHHGDGVMYGFYDDGHLLDIDFHEDGRSAFPGTGFPRETGTGDGAGRKVNVPLPPGAGDEALLPLFRRLVPPLLREFRPEVIVLQHGVDGHAGDPLVQLQYTPAAYLEIERTVLVLADELCDGRLVVTGGGGYRPESVSRVLARAGRLFGRLPLPAPDQATPTAWCAEFFEVTGTVAPDRWAGPEPLSPSPWRAEDEEGLVAELERHLGTKFPLADQGGGWTGPGAPVGTGPEARRST